MPPPETILSEEKIYEGEDLDLALRRVEMEGGPAIEREIVMTPGAVVIVPLTANNEVRLVKQYRSAAQKWLIELPAGGLEPGEDPAQAAPRELAEETGDQAGRWRRVTGFYSAPGFLTEYLHVYLATDLTPGPQALEQDEQIERLTVPWPAALQMIRRGEIEDAKTIAGLLAVGLELGWLINGSS